MRLQNIAESVSDRIPLKAYKNIQSAILQKKDMSDYIGMNLDELGLTDKLSNFINNEYAMPVFYKSISSDGMDKDGTKADVMLSINDKISSDDPILNEKELFNLNDKDFSEYLGLHINYPDVTFLDRNKKFLPLTKYKELVGKYKDREKEKSFNSKESHSDEVEESRRIIEADSSLSRHTGVKDVISQSIIENGPSKAKNRFLKYMSELPFDITDTELGKNVSYIFNAYTNGKLDISHKYLLNKSLFDRDLDDFRKTINAFEIVYDSDRLSDYLKDTSVADVSEFMNGNTIKSAKDILRIIDSWAVDNEYPNDVSHRGRKKRTKPAAGLSVKQLTQIKAMFANKGSRDEIEAKYPSVKKDGTVIWAPSVTNSVNSIQDYMDGGKFWRYSNGNWEEYDTPDARNVLSGAVTN